MSTLRIGGRDARRTARRHVPPTMTDRLAADLARWGDPNADPYTVDPSLSPELRASYVADMAVWFDQALEELATKARKAHRLAAKVADPALQGHDRWPEAVQRSKRLDADVAADVWTIVSDEARVDRAWRSLSVTERTAARLDMLWNTPATTERLIGLVWHRAAKEYAWPRGFRMRREWLHGIPFQALIDLRLAGVFKLEFSPWPPSIFDGTQAGPTPADIAVQIAKANGDPQ